MEEQRPPKEEQRTEQRPALVEHTQRAVKTVEMLHESKSGRKGLGGKSNGIERSRWRLNRQSHNFHDLRVCGLG